MLDLPGFWSGWVVVLTVVGLAWLAWLLYAVYFGRDKSVPEEYVWDEDLREGNAPPPWWWFGLLVATLVFSCAYLLLYPGLGAFRGALAWTQQGQLQQSVRADAQEHRALWSRWGAALPDELAEDEMAMRVARRIFRNRCANCHGADAKGQAGLFPDLTDAAWSWGNDEEQLRQSLWEGRTGVMPGWLAVIGEQGVRDVTAYTLSLSRGGDDGESIAAGKAIFEQFCVACHGVDGRGLAALGAPDMTDGVWLYGGDEASVSLSVSQGRTGIMPAQKGRLTEEQVRLLVAWLKAGADTRITPR